MPSKGAYGMLRITEKNNAGDTTILYLEGRVVGPWVAEVQRSCEPSLAKGLRLTLDMAEVSFVDRDGILLIHHLISRPGTLVNCPPFLAEQLKENLSETNGPFKQDT